MDTDSEEEIFFGPVTDKEKQVAHKFYEKFPGELRISSCLTYGIAGSSADVLPDRNLDESSPRNSTVSEDLVFIMDESNQSIMLETKVENPSDPDRSLDGSSVRNSTVSEDTVFISDKSKHGIMLETNVGDPSDVLRDRSLDGSSVRNPTVSEDTVFISDKSKHGIMLETNVGNPSDVLRDRSLDGSSVRNPTVSEDTVFISDKSKHGIMLETNVGNPSDVLRDRSLDGSSVRNPTVSEDTVFISDKSKQGIMLETNVGNPSGVLRDRSLDGSSVRNPTVSEDTVFISDKSKHGIMLETNVGNPSDVLPERILDESYAGNSIVSEDKVYISDENKHVIKLETNDGNPSDVSPGRILVESSVGNSTVFEDIVLISDESKRGIMLEASVGNPSDVLPDRILDESFVGNSTVSEDEVYISDKNKHVIMLETNDGNPSDKLEGETSDGSSLITEKMLASPLHDECFCITLEINTNELSDFEWLQEDSYTSEALVSPFNDGSKPGIVLERELSVILSENTKDESSEGNHISQASAPPQNDKSEHNNTLENAEIQSASQVSERRTEDDVVENLSVEFAYRLGEALPPPGDYVTLEGNVSGSTENGEDKIIVEESLTIVDSRMSEDGIQIVEDCEGMENAVSSGSTENGEDKIIVEESLTIVDSRMSEDGIQIVEDCEGMENAVSSGKCSPDKTSSNKEVEGNKKEMSNIFSMTLTIDDSKDIHVPEFCLSDEEEPANELNNTLDLVNTIMLEHFYQRCSPSKLADLKRSIQCSVAAAQHRHDTVNLVSDDDYSFTGDSGHPSGDENDDIENKKEEYVFYDEKYGENNKENDKTNYCRNVDPILDVLSTDKEGSDCYSYNKSSHTESNNDVAGSNNVEDYTSRGQKKIEHKSPDVEIPVKCPPKFGYSSCKVKPRTPASREKQFQKSPGQKLLLASTPRYRELQSPLQSYLRSEPTLIQVVKPKLKMPRHKKNFWCLEASPDATSTKQSSVCPKMPLTSPNTLPIVRYTSRPTVDINGPGTPIAATGPCERIPGTITPIVTKHIGHVKIVNSGSPLKLAESRLSIVQSHLAGRSDTLAGHTEASGKRSPSKFVGHKIPNLKSNLAGRADHGKPKKEGIIVGSKTELTPKRRGEL